MADLTKVESHFRFGENWAKFAGEIGPDKIATARSELARLLGAENLHGVSFLDIGSGSGLHSLAALELGASRVVAVDIDPMSVETTRRLLERFSPGRPWVAQQCSVFDPAFEQLGAFDIVYSWGVLHHTGRMNEAIARAARRVKPGGLFCVSLYARTQLCGFWRMEKRFYSGAPAFVQAVIRGLFSAWTRVLLTLLAYRRGERFDWRSHVADYSTRGMSFRTDLHDWLGGYPYESITPEDMRTLMAALGFEEVRCFLPPGRRHGLLGSGCDEYVFRARDTDGDDASRRASG